MKKGNVRIYTGLLALLIAGGGGASALAAAVTFTGGAGADLTVDSNWSSGTYPTSADYAIINTTADLSSAAPNSILAIRVGSDGTGVLNVSSGGDLEATSSSSWDSHVGGSAGNGTVNQSGGRVSLNYVEIGRGGTGLYSLTGGLLTVPRGKSGVSVYLGTDDSLGVNDGDGTLEISGGVFTTRSGVHLGSSDGSGVGTFSVLGSLPVQVGIGSNDDGDGTWSQNAGSTLKVGIDSLGVTKILVDEVDGDGGQSVTFQAGALLDVDYYGDGAGGGTWTVMELENGDIVDNGLAFAAGVDTGIWSFNIDNSGTNGFLTVTASGAPITETNVTADSLRRLQQYAAMDNMNVTMTPGTYTVEADDVANGFFPDTLTITDITYNVLLLFSGNNSTYELTNVTLNVESGVWQQGYGTEGIYQLQVIGNSNVIKNLTMVDVGTVDDDPVDGCVNVVMDGRANRIEGFDMTIKGSYPYGYGDCFGKGTGPVIPHNKHSAFLIRGDYNHAKNCSLLHHSYGHGMFMQAASHPTIEGCYVEGEMRSTDDMLAETSGPAYDVGFMTVWGFTLPGGYTKSLAEAGIRAYNTGETIIDGVGYDRGTDNPTIIDNTIVNMRVGVTLTHATGTKYVSGCTAIGTERGYAIGSGIIENCSADVQYGPAFGIDYESDSGITADITILPYEGSHTNGSRHFAYIYGSDHNLTFRGAVPNPDQTLKVNVGGDRTIESDLYTNENFSADSIVIKNYTGYPLVLDDNSSNIDGQSIGSVTDDGTGNSITATDWSRTNNLAFYGTATQSSTEYYSTYKLWQIASLATDQNTDGARANGSVSRTADESQPWWKIDLGGLYDISEIKIWNRTSTSTIMARLSNYDVVVLDDSELSVWTSYQADYPNPSLTLNPPDSTVGQYVMIQLRGTDVLSLAEVEVYGTAAGSIAETAPRAHWPLDEDSGSIAYDSSTNGFDGTVLNAEWTLGQVGGALDFNVSDASVNIPAAAFSTISNEVSIAFWAYGGDSMPAANSAFYAENSSGDRVLNVHLPYSNGTIYWDAGDNAGYDRINKAALESEYKGSWTHWVFTKNAVSGTMQIFRNGALWHSGTGKTRTMEGIVLATIGSKASALSYPGLLDDVRLYDTALSAAAVGALYDPDSVPKVGEFVSYQDVGSPSLAGSVSYSNGVYTVIGGGSDIQGTADDFYFVYDRHSGDGEIAAQVTSVENTDTWAKAGPMFRETAETGSKNVFIAVRPDNQISMQVRDSTDGAATDWSLTGGTGVKWVKLGRSGDDFTGSYSTDGQSWTTLATATVSMAGDIERGLAVTSHDDAALCTATFNLVPPAPAGLTADSIDEDQVDLDWNAAVNAMAYNLKRSTTGGGSYALTAGELTSTNYSDTGLSAGTNYYYVVCGEYMGVEGGASAEAFAVPSALINPDDVVIGSVEISSGGQDLMFSVSNSVPGHNYRVLASDDLINPDWQVVSGTNSGIGGLLLIEIPVDSADTNRFYRLETWRQ